LAGEARQILELRSSSCDQQVWCGVVEAKAVKLVDGAGEFGDLSAQLQNPERQWIIAHAQPARSAAPSSQ
jgi:hypothetical protein